MFDTITLNRRHATDLHGPNRRGVRLSLAEEISVMAPGEALSVRTRALLSAATRSERAFLLAALRAKATAETFAAIVEAARAVLSAAEFALFFADRQPEPPFGVAA
jgi:hypothetical protein